MTPPFDMGELKAIEEELFSGKPSKQFSEQQIRLSEVEFDNTPLDTQRATEQGQKSSRPDYKTDAGAFFPDLQGSSVTDPTFVDPEKGKTEQNITNLLNRINRLELQMEVVRRKFDQFFLAFEEMRRAVANKNSIGGVDLG